MEKDNVPPGGSTAVDDEPPPPPPPPASTGGPTSTPTREQADAERNARLEGWRVDTTTRTMTSPDGRTAHWDEDTGGWRMDGTNEPAPEFDARYDDMVNRGDFEQQHEGTPGGGGGGGPSRVAGGPAIDEDDDDPLVPKRDKWEGWKVIEDPEDPLVGPTLRSPTGERVHWDPHERRWDVPEEDERNFDEALRSIREREARRRSQLDADE